MARARNGNRRGTPTGPFGRRSDRVLKTAGRPTPRTGGGMKLPTKKAPIAGPKNVDPKPLPKRRKPRLQVDPRKPRRPRGPVPRLRRRR